MHAESEDSLAKEYLMQVGTRFAVQFQATTAYLITMTGNVFRILMSNADMTYDILFSLISTIVILWSQ